MSEPLCRYCGKPIKKRTTMNWIEKSPGMMRETPLPWSRQHLIMELSEIPTTKAQCQRLTKEVVVSVSLFDKRVRSFTSWDGKSYVDEYFCNADHARKMGYAAVKSGFVTDAWRKATTRKPPRE